MTTITDLFDTARDLHTGDRNAAYGDPISNHSNIAKLMTAYLQVRFPSFKESLDAEDAAWLMLLVKQARAAQRIQHREDTLVDAINYTAFAGAAAISREEDRKIMEHNLKELKSSEGNLLKELSWKKVPEEKDNDE